ncbi:MAG: carboxypeptidase regulatory-like domain-containing protein [Treponema sp.]|nr:carboxypeptidase regulatory-like domain-containing protein [Treponema sp.]MCL2272301.1 carboxypeptidase regulatory-like domain-containing protein [Treponema sp.]
MNSKSIIIAGFAFLLSASCKTTEFDYKVFDVNGMIYDFSNRPIPYCEITLGKRYNGSTDINGRFTLPKVPTGKYLITVTKSSFETYTDYINIIDRNQIIYIRIPSLNQLLEMVDDSLTKKNLFDAEEIIKRAYLIDQNNIEMLFYYATIKYQQQKHDEAIGFLITAKNLGSKDEYIEKFLSILRGLINE